MEPSQKVDIGRAHYLLNKLNHKQYYIKRNSTLYGLGMRAKWSTIISQNPALSLSVHLSQSQALFFLRG